MVHNNYFKMMEMFNNVTSSRLLKTPELFTDPLICFVSATRANVTTKTAPAIFSVLVYGAATSIFMRFQNEAGFFSTALPTKQVR